MAAEVSAARGDITWGLGVITPEERVSETCWSVATLWFVIALTFAFNLGLGERLMGCLGFTARFTCL